MTRCSVWLLLWKTSWMWGIDCCPQMNIDNSTDCRVWQWSRLHEWRSLLLVWDVELLSRSEDFDSPSLTPRSRCQRLLWMLIKYRWWHLADPPNKPTRTNNCGLNFALELTVVVAHLYCIVLYNIHSTKYMYRNHHIHKKSSPVYYSSVLDTGLTVLATEARILPSCSRRRTVQYLLAAQVQQLPYCAPGSLRRDWR